MSEFPELHTLWNYNDPAGTAVRFEALLPMVEASDNRAYHAELLSQLARTHSLRRQFTEAQQLLDEAEALLTDGMVVPRMCCLLERGRSFNSASEPERALPLFQEAFALGTAVSPQADFYTIDAAHMVAIAEPDAAEQIKWNEKPWPSPKPHPMCGRLVGAAPSTTIWAGLTMTWVNTNRRCLFLRRR